MDYFVSFLGLFILCLLNNTMTIKCLGKEFVSNNIKIKAGSSLTLPLFL
jgi:hypothetical protein